MEIFILVSLVFIMIFVLVRISLVILRRRSTSSNNWEAAIGPDERKATLDDEEPPHHYDPSYLGSPLYKIRKSRDD